MNIKLDVSQFETLKSEILKKIEDFEKKYEEASETLDFNEEEFNNAYINELFQMQKKLLLYDLSDIPYEAWKDFNIISDPSHIADFSKSHANIDFDLVGYYGDGKFNGCNVRNLDKIEKFVNPSMFDEKVIKENSNLFLDNSFSKEFQEKYYSNLITIKDLANLNSEQLKNLKNYKIHMNYMFDITIIEDLGLERTIQLYNHSKEEYAAISNILNVYKYSRFIIKEELPSYEQIIEQISNSKIEDIKDICFDLAKRRIIFGTDTVKSEEYPKMFIDENPNLFLISASIPDEVKNRYFDRNLSIKDLIEYSDTFKDIPIDNFMSYDTQIDTFFNNNYGVGKFQELVIKHPDFFSHVCENGEQYNFSIYLQKGMDFNTDFINAVKDYFIDSSVFDDYVTFDNNGDVIYNAPDWLSSMNFKFINNLTTTDDLLNYDENVVIINYIERMVIRYLNIDNILKLENETKMFSHKKYDYSNDLEMFKALCYYFTETESSLRKSILKFNKGSLPYEEFLVEIVNCLDEMRKRNIFSDISDYDWIRGEFRDKYSNIFMDIDAPEGLKTAFYNNAITPSFIYNHKECIPFLINKDLANILRIDMKLNMLGMSDENGNMIPYTVDFISEYISRYGNEKLLNLIAKYGDVLSNLKINSIHGEINDENAIEMALINAIYNKIINTKFDYSYLSDSLSSIYPELFVDFSNLSISIEEQLRLTEAFYNRYFSFDDIRKYPELVEILKDKNLKIAFGNKKHAFYNNRVTFNDYENSQVYNDLELIELLGNEKILKMCSKYGRYMNGIGKHIRKDFISRIDLNGDDIYKVIENIISRECILGNIDYSPSDAPEFLLKNNPELFLSDDAPDELKKYFYNYGNNYIMTFDILRKHKDWLPFLEGKSVKTALFKSSYLKEDMIKFFELFGDEKAIKLGITRTETVNEMIRSHQVDLMKNWYDKTGGKFIPDFVVMQNFRLNEADKFLVSGSNWSNLMRYGEYSCEPEYRDAMLKVAYSFGAFDQDQRGFRKLQDLLISLPKNIPGEYGYIFDYIDSKINLYSQKETIFSNKYSKDEKEKAYFEMIDHLKNNQVIDKFTNVDLLNLFESMRKEKLDIDFSKDIFSQLYRKNESGTYSITINQQNYPITSHLIRNILNQFGELPIINPDKAHQLFGGFELKYDPEFREFFISNMDKIMSNPEYASLIASIQRQFYDIKTVNSNRALTLNLAVSYVQSNKYDSVNVGNEKVAEISSIAGYSQVDFDVLQKVYNYGKQRVFSSIPRIVGTEEKRTGKYTYEMLRLDDPLAMAIGTLTNCCQELNNCAEVCMEHSMVDKNGRVFVIKDEFNNVVAQSWVWRNKDVLCFDNIEIPDKAFARITKEYSEVGNTGFSDEIFEIYKKAAQDLIEKDEKIYKELLLSGKITQEQYDGLRLGKVTVGLGYNDIAKSLQQNSKIDTEAISRPLDFEPPVKLSRGLYTNDSTTQYVLEKREDRKQYDGETLTIHNDNYVEYDDSNFDTKSLLLLCKLEDITKYNKSELKLDIGSYIDSNNIVTNIANDYNLNPKTTKIIMNPNFAIIYENSEDKIKIADLLFNTYIDNDSQQIDIKEKVIMQINLAINQISNGKEIDISHLNEKQKEIFDLSIELSDEIDMERGIACKTM